MTVQKEFQERVVRVKRPTHHFKYLTSEDGAMLGLNDAGDLVLREEADDQVIWDFDPNGLQHVASLKPLDAKFENGRCLVAVDGEIRNFSIDHGPEKLPSEYLKHLKKEGWVCLTCILTEGVVDNLQRVAGSDAYEHLEMNNDSPKICQDVAVGQAISEPISLWLIRQYMQTRDLHLGHPPGFAVLRPYDGESRVQGWHSDIPYIPSVGGNLVADRKGPIKAVQRNVCVSDFKKENGATAYKLGSHTADNPPPEWNPARFGGPPNARPYSGPEADVVEAPAGSIVLYDARTWHRAGFNHSEHKRAAMLQSFQTADVIPKRDTRPACKRWQASSVYEQLNLRQQREITELLMNQPDLPS
ncbi:MAG: phytanoyl-CoA dioxygenase family protein [Gammaproteobacteria bacterium]|nr:phytanoyl-CoA dioxygenase family protein [Gammaproteobacteria bacterium]